MVFGKANVLLVPLSATVGAEERGKQVSAALLERLKNDAGNETSVV
jgi:hypothetical protein